MPNAVHTPDERSSTPSRGEAGPLRVVVQQPSLAKYRLPVYQELASRAGIDFRLVYGKEAGIPNVEPEGIEADFLAHRAVPGFRWMPAHFRVTGRGFADVVVMPGNVRHLSLMPALRRARKHRIGVVLWTHGYSKHERGIMDRVRRKSLDLGDAVLLYNNAAKRQLAEAGLPEEKLFVALNSLDQAPIRAARERTLAYAEGLADFRREHSIDPSQTIIYVSRFEPANRLDMLIDAAAALREQFPRLTVAIIGKGEQRAELEAHARSRGVADVCRFLGAIYEEDELAKWFCSSVVFCYPANIGLSLLHALGYGLPVVTSDRLEAQNPEIEALEHDGNGLLYQDGSVAALTETLGRLLRDRELRDRLSAGALRTVEERFSVRNMVDGIVAACRFASERAAARR